MNKSIDQRLKGKELEVWAAIHAHDVPVAMAMFNVRQRLTFARWMRTHREYDPHPGPLNGMSGGEKAKWKRQHREMILGCLEFYGEAWVREQFGFTGDTLAGFVKHEKQPFAIDLSKVSHAQRAELKANTALNAIERIEHALDLMKTRVDLIALAQREDSQEHAQIKDQFNNFIPTVSGQVGERLTGLVELLLQNSIRLDESFLLKPHPDPLNIEALLAQGKEWQEKELVKGGK